MRAVTGICRSISASSSCFTPLVTRRTSAVKDALGVRRFIPCTAARDADKPLSNIMENSVQAASTPVEAVTQSQTGLMSAAALLMTPEASLLGGLTIGVAAAGKLSMTGRVTGISGTFGGLIRGSADSWRLAYLAGMGAGGLMAMQLMPGAIQAIPDTYTVGRAVMAGLLVGYGTSMGSGCTSGHGVCGLARLSKRSLAAVMAFMATGALVASLAGTAIAAGVPSGYATPWLSPSPEQLQINGSVLGGAIATWLLLRGLARFKVLSTATLGLVSEFAFGAVFALGLAAGGMLSPAKVAAFLSPLASYFDPSLMFVMGGALLVTTPAFQYMMRAVKAPVCATSLDLPTKSVIDVPLLMGSVMFGAGWGLGGLCPGPALVSLVQPCAQNLSFAAAMAAGMLLHSRKGISFPAKSLA